MCPGRPEAHSEEFVELAIERIGARGDGVAQYRGEPVFVPFTVPAIASALGSGRAAPRCRRFGTGGGCALQHLDDASYRRVKLETLHTALEREQRTFAEVDQFVAEPFTGADPRRENADRWARRARRAPAAVPAARAAAAR